MQSLRADHLGMCFGVRDAIALARQQASIRPITVLGELVHNEQVLSDLRAAGVQIESDLSKVQTRHAIITAHGASEKAMNAAREHGLELLEGTCPLVHHAHQAVRDLASKGYFPVIIGKKDHVEVRGLTGDLDEFAVVLTDEDVDALPFKPKIGVASQTTQPTHRVQYLLGRIRKRFPTADIHFRDTVCRPTRQRQAAAEELARKCDVVIVIGGANSNNTKELVNTCSRFCERVHHVQFPGEVQQDWFAGRERIGITAGTSTPDELIDSVEKEIRRLN
ncbi:MAG: 4-hydroxy-3-methylbut-2-enyl diphosphate reductase [Verrucomicrobiota bacterium]